jgi:aspartate carbamoyltransferase regulatory subunit
MELLQKAIEKVPETVKEILKCAKAKCALDNNNIETASNHLSLVDCEACNNDSEEDFNFLLNQIDMKF